jgi:hypothetical protein
MIDKTTRMADQYKKLFTQIWALHHLDLLQPSEGWYNVS